MSDADYDRRTPPYSDVAEQSVLGSMMLSAKAIEDVLDLHLASRDFYLPKHEVVFQAIVNLFEHGNPAGALEVADELERTGQLAKAGGQEYPFVLIGIPATAANAGYYAEIVANKAVSRRLVEAGTRVAQMGYASEGAVEDLVDAARLEIENVASVTGVQVESMQTDAPTILREFRRELTLLPSCWPELDEYTGGFGPGRVYVVGARPGVGKSAFATHVAYDLAATGTVIFSTMEMSKGEVYSRIIAQQASVYYPKQGRLSEFNEAKEAAFIATDSRDIRVLDDSTQTIAMIRAAARTAARDGKLSGIVIDYLHLLTEPGNTEQERLTSITRALKQMSKDFQCPVIALSQLNRQTAKGADVPGLADLRGSGTIEQDADVVIMLSRHTDEDGQFTDKDVLVTLPKNRHGQAFVSFTLDFEGQFFQFQSRDPRANH